MRIYRSKFGINKQETITKNTKINMVQPHCVHKQERSSTMKLKKRIYQMPASKVTPKLDESNKINEKIQEFSPLAPRNPIVRDTSQHIRRTQSPWISSEPKNEPFKKNPKTFPSFFFLTPSLPSMNLDEEIS